MPRVRKGWDLRGRETCPTQASCNGQVRAARIAFLSSARQSEIASGSGGRTAQTFDAAARAVAMQQQHLKALRAR